MEDKIMDMILNKYGTLSKFCKQYDFPWSTVKTMLTRGLLNSSIGNVIKLCEALNLDLEEIAKGKIACKTPKYDDQEYMLIACHHETGKLTEEEKEEIKQFAEFVKTRNK